MLPRLFACLFVGLFVYLLASRCSKGYCSLSLVVQGAGGGKQGEKKERKGVSKSGGTQGVQL